MNKLILIGSAIVLFIIGCVMFVTPTPEPDEFFCFFFIVAGLAFFAFVVDTFFSLILGVSERIKW